MEVTLSRRLLECVARHPSELHTLGRPLLQADEADLAAAIGELDQQLQTGGLSADANWWPDFFEMLHSWLQAAAERLPLGPTVRESIVRLYRSLGNRCSDRYQLLVLLAVSGAIGDLQQLTVLLREDPPQDGDALAAPFVPLLHERSQAACMFPAITACVDNPYLAAPILDLANYLTRTGIVVEHPLKSASSRLIALLRGLTGRLESLAEDSEPTAEQRRAAALGLMTVVALADALALIGAAESIVALKHAMELPHRRIRVEVAAAPARLEDEAGKQALLACAREPVSRLRAIRYAQELGCDHELEETFQSDVAIAEAELVSYLSQIDVMGIPPTECRLLDHRTLYWPGYEEPRDCYLFQFTYHATRGNESLSYSNVGIAGPLAHAFAADLLSLDLDDIYAAYAGWQAEHAEIRQQPYEALPPGAQPFQSLLDRARQTGRRRHPFRARR